MKCLFIEICMLCNDVKKKFNVKNNYKLVIKWWYRREQLIIICNNKLTYNYTVRHLFSYFSIELINIQKIAYNIPAVFINL